MKTTTKGADMKDAAPPVNREGWLAALATEFEPMFESIGHPLERPYRVTCGFPSSKARAATRRAIGECWTSAASGDGANELFVSPTLADPMDVAATLVHELAHAADNCENGHRGPFVRMVRALGLTGKPTATTAGEGFVEIADPILAKLGPYPHSALAVGIGAKKKAGTRLLKVECEDCLAEGEPYIVRMSRAAIERGLPICPIHDRTMSEPGL